jgi:hypothetical protein
MQKSKKRQLERPMSDEITLHTEWNIGSSDRTPELIQTIATPTSLEMKLSDGSTISYPRNPINVGTLTFSYNETDEGRYSYKYTLDNRQVEMIRVGEFTRQFASPILKGPPGWMGVLTGWHASSAPIWKETVSRSEAAEYTILSVFLPGPLYLYIRGHHQLPDNEFTLPFSGANASEHYLMQQISLKIRLYANSVEPLTIGPLFKPEPPEQEVRDRIHQWVDAYGFEFLRPLDDETVNLMENEGAVIPRTNFEAQVLDCLKVAIRAMVGDAV